MSMKDEAAMAVSGRILRDPKTKHHSYDATGLSV